MITLVRTTTVTTAIRAITLVLTSPKVAVNPAPKANSGAAAVAVAAVVAGAGAVAKVKARVAVKMVGRAAMPQAQARTVLGASSRCEATAITPVTRRVATAGTRVAISASSLANPLLQHRRLHNRAQNQSFSTAPGANSLRQN